MAGLDFVEACAHEAMRLKPVAPFNSLVALRDTVVGDVRVPAGTALFCVMRHDSMDERFVAEAQVFKPQRWMADNMPGQNHSHSIRPSICSKHSAKRGS